MELSRVVCSFGQQAQPRLLLKSRLTLCIFFPCSSLCFYFFNMTRATEAYTVGAIVIATYFILYMGILPLGETVQTKIIPVVS